jgi:hypothetical protein
MPPNPNNQVEKSHYEIKIVRRPWYQWVFSGIWLFLEIVFFQAAIASYDEFEPRAATVYWALFGILLLGGFTVWIVRRQDLI